MKKLEKPFDDEKASMVTHGRGGLAAMGQWGMRSPRPSQEASLDSPVAASGGGLPVPADLDFQADAENLVRTLMASGDPFSTAMAQAALIYGADAPAGLMEEFIKSHHDGRDRVTFLDAVAELAPEAANTWLSKLLAEDRLSGWMVGAQLTLDLRGRDWITSLPPGLRPAGDLDVSRCRNLRALPPGMTSGFSVRADDCVSLAEIPAGLTVDGGLSLQGCPALTGLPAGIQVGEWLTLKQCPSLVGIPQDLEVGWRLDIEACPALESLPRGIRVARGIIVRGCAAFKHLPDGITLRGDLTIADCPSLRSLPKGMAIHDLHLVACPAWDGRIPDDARIEGSLFLPHEGTGMPLDKFRRQEARLVERFLLHREEA